MCSTQKEWGDEAVVSPVLGVIFNISPGCLRWEGRVLVMGAGIRLDTDWNTYDTKSIPFPSSTHCRLVGPLDQLQIVNGMQQMLAG